MAHFFEGDGGYSTLIYGEQANSLSTFQQSTENSFLTNLNDSARMFMDKTREIVGQVNNLQLKQRAVALYNKSRYMFDEDCIHPFVNYGHMQQAKPIMQRFMMAEPSIRGMYNKQRISGYNDEFYNPFPDHVGENHYDYRKVTDGIVIIDEDTGDWTSTSWSDDFTDDDVLLNHSDQTDILTSWDNAKIWLSMGKDITSPEGDEL